MDAFALPLMFVTMIALIVGGLWIDRERREPGEGKTERKPGRTPAEPPPERVAPRLAGPRPRRPTPDPRRPGDRR